MAMRFDLRHLESFTVLAEELHFGRAAARLHVTQPALSRTIRQLENALGYDLLRRTTRKVELTDAGRTFCKESAAGLAQIGKAVEAGRETAQGVVGQVRLAYMDFAITGGLPDLVQAFRDAHPAIRLRLEYMPTALQRDSLLQQRIDIGFMIGSFDFPDARELHVEDHSFVVLLPENHRLTGARQIGLADLANEDFVLGDLGWSAFRERLFALCRGHGFLPNIAQEASTTEGIFGLVSVGVGISVYASSARRVHRRGMVVRPLADVSEMIPTIAVWDARAETPGLRTFIAFLRRRLAAGR